MEGLIMGIFMFLGILAIMLGLGGFLSNRILYSIKHKEKENHSKVIVYVAKGNKYVGYYAQKCSKSHHPNKNANVHMKSAAV